MQNLFVRVETCDVHFTHVVLGLLHVLFLKYTDHIDAMVRFEQGNRERRFVNLKIFDFIRSGIKEFGSPVTGVGMLYKQAIDIIGNTAFAALTHAISMAENCFR